MSCLSAIWERRILFSVVNPEERGKEIEILRKIKERIEQYIQFLYVRTCVLFTWILLETAVSHDGHVTGEST